MGASPSSAVPRLSNVTALPRLRKGDDGVEESSRDDAPTGHMLAPDSDTITEFLLARFWVSAHLKPTRLTRSSFAGSALCLRKSRRWRVRRHSDHCGLQGPRQ